jgi:hypothetical protein
MILRDIPEPIYRSQQQVAPKYKRVLKTIPTKSGAFYCLVIPGAAMEIF